MGYMANAKGDWDMGVVYGGYICPRFPPASPHRSGAGSVHTALHISRTCAAFCPRSPRHGTAPIVSVVLAAWPRAAVTSGCGDGGQAGISPPPGQAKGIVCLPGGTALSGGGSNLCLEEGGEGQGPQVPRRSSSRGQRCWVD